MQLIISSTAKTTCSSDGLGKGFNNLDIRSHNLLNNELGDSIAGFDFVILAAVIKQENSNLASVISIDNSSTSRNTVLYGQSASRSNSSICIYGYSNGDICLDKSSSMGRNNCTFAAIHVVTCRVFRPPCRSLCVGGEELDLHCFRAVWCVVSSCVDRETTREVEIGNFQR